MDEYEDIDLRVGKKELGQQITGDKKPLPNITLYMDRDVQDLLRETARKENRPISRQVVHMLEYYLEHTKNTK